MSNIIETSTTIHAPAAKVWEVFVNPKVTHKVGIEYVSDWQVGSPVSFKLGDNQIAKGKILAVEPQQRWQHSLLSPDGTTVVSTVTYLLQADGEQTILTGHEELAGPLGYADDTSALENWQATLAVIKRAAEA